MDKQTAIDLLDNLLGMVEDNHDSDYDTAIKMGIDALKMQLSKEDATFPVEGATLDCISRQQAILAIERNAYRHTYVDQIVDIIKWLPSVQPQRMSDDETCDSCRYRDNEINEAPCDGCTPENSHYCPNSKREWYQKGYEAGQKSAQPLRMKGRWINNCRCSECGYSEKNYSDAPNNFCPVCGADMREG